MEVKPKSIHRRDPRVILFIRIGASKNKQHTTNTIHLDETICLGLIYLPTKNKNKPIIQAIIWRKIDSGATELIIKMLIQKRKAKLIVTGNQGFFDINQF